MQRYMEAARILTASQVGTKVLIADLGGGTLDFQCLKIVQLDPLKTEEACKGEGTFAGDLQLSSTDGPHTGGKSGSTYIDFNLHDFLKESFGDAFTSLHRSKTAAGSAFMDDWELCKRTFDGKDPNKNFRLGLPALGKALKAAKLSHDKYDFEDWKIIIKG